MADNLDFDPIDLLNWRYRAVKWATLAGVLHGAQMHRSSLDRERNARRASGALDEKADRRSRLSANRLRCIVR